MLFPARRCHLEPPHPLCDHNLVNSRTARHSRRTNRTFLIYHRTESGREEDVERRLHDTVGPQEDARAAAAAGAGPETRDGRLQRGLRLERDPGARPQEDRSGGRDGRDGRDGKGGGEGGTRRRER